MKKGGDAMASELPATSEILLPTDASKQILDTFLGQGWDTWGAGLGGSQASELMLQIFSAFNLVALAVISALFLWVMALAVAGTAHEGVPFGKRFSSLWMPLRFVGAMGALAPIFKGLSLFQVAILACIGFSINLGNFVWELGTDYFVEHAGQITVQAPDQNVTHYAAITNGALESLTLQYYLNERRGMNISPGGEWNYKSNWFRSGGEYQFLFNGNAGSIQVSCVDESDALCRGKVNAVGTAISALSSVAQQLADPETPSSSIDPRALHSAANQVNETILSELQSYAGQGQLQSKLADFQENSAQYGWLIAGSSYWSIAWINQEVREAMYSGITYSPHQYTVSELYAWTHGLQDYEAAKERVANYIKTAYSSRRGITDITATPSVTDEGRAFDELTNWLRATLNQLVAANILPIAVEKLSSQDPIMAISNVGDYFIGTAWGRQGHSESGQVYLLCPVRRFSSPSAVRAGAGLLPARHSLHSLDFGHGGLDHPHCGSPGRGPALAVRPCAARRRRRCRSARQKRLFSSPCHHHPSSSDGGGILCRRHSHERPRQTSRSQL